ncbi:hypothetical protein SAMN04488063_3172 [Halopelagius inordinatus]|uniref:Uncharacterized protein n=1 Tax=Halopelagius inordinatus TaxID=553467 RepID=A0A1I2VJ72_9EURY|nr:hypothetical protein SAMN04488063_3172 [Halopelagius inordinatus]
MADSKFFVSLLIAGLLILAGVSILGYALLVAGQLLLGLFGFVVCLAMASLLVWKTR